jgi:adenosine deaminase
MADHDIAPLVTEAGRWIAGLPKVELHVHLEGSLQPHTVAELAARHNRDTTEIWPDGLPDSFSFVDFPDFARQFWFGLSLLKTGDDLRAVISALGQLNTELGLVHAHHGVSLERLRSLQLAAVDASFADDAVKSSLRAAIAGY